MIRASLALLFVAQVASAQVQVLAPTAATVGHDRVALVIGNSQYRHASQDLSDLPASANDARDLTEALRGFGFTVLLGTDLTKGQMRDAVRQFGSRAEGVEAALFFYSGHGMQDADGETNYLIPSGADPRSTAELVDQGYDLRSALAELVERDRPPELSMFLLDACRTRLPTPGRMGAITGYTPDWGDSVRRGDAGTIIVHATQAGEAASAPAGLAASRANSFFTRSLLETLRTDSGLSVHAFFPEVRGRVRRLTGNSQHPDVDEDYDGDFRFELPLALPTPPLSTLDRMERALYALYPESTISNTYTVRAGDTLFRIARINDISVDTITSLNYISQSILHVGQTLRLDESTPMPLQNYYRVPTSGQSVNEIAAATQTSAESLARSNPRLGSVAPSGIAVRLPEPRHPALWTEAPLPAPLSTGLALVYPDAMRGRRMSNGEQHDPSEFVLSHRTLPFGTMVLLTNPISGSRAIARVADRGPVSLAYLVEVSAAVATALELDPNASRRLDLRLLP